jgi:hypothetical protein
VFIAAAEQSESRAICHAKGGNGPHLQVRYWKIYFLISDKVTGRTIVPIGTNTQSMNPDHAIGHPSAGKQSGNVKAVRYFSNTA